MIAWLPVAAALIQAVAPPAPPPAPPIAIARPGPLTIVPAGDGSGTTTLFGVPVTVRFELASDGARGELVFRAGNGFRYAAIPIDEPDAALLVLADRRLQFAAPALLAWAGADLTGLRDRRIARLTAAVAAGAAGEQARSTSESAARPALAVRFQLARALADSGRPDDAIATVVAAGPRDPRGSSWQRTEFSLIAIRLANIEHNAGRSDAAIARLRAARAAMKPTDKYAQNIDSNLAALLAETGRAAEALALADATRAALPRNAIAGSDRHFAWIRACALQQLGRTAEAAAERRRFLDAPPAFDRDFVAADGYEIARRGLTCLNDVAGMVQLLADQAAATPIAPYANLWAQPGFRAGSRAADFVAAVGRDPRLRAAVATTYAPLAPALAPALRGWR